MPVSGFTVGRDVSIDIVSAKKGLVRFPIKTGFSRKQESVQIKSKGLDGIIRFGVVPDGWSGSIEIDRASSDVDDYFAEAEADYYAGRNIDTVSITETVVEPTGATTQYRYTGVALQYSDAGSLKGDDKVPLKIDWMASKRLKIA